MRAELAGLAVLLESHFVYEEKKLASALNSLNAQSWDGLRPNFLLTTSDAVSDLGSQAAEPQAWTPSPLTLDSVGRAGKMQAGTAPAGILLLRRWL
jgi:hypothetical protein